MNRRNYFFWIFICLGIVSGFLSLARISGAEDAASKPQRPNLILITVQDLRADTLEAGVGGDLETAGIASLREEGVYFTQHFHPSSSVLPNAVSLLTGLYPPKHGVRDDTHFVLPETVPALPVLLKKAGYSTYAFLGSDRFPRDLGLARGFDHYDTTFLEKGGIQRELFPVPMSGSRLNAKVFDLLENKHPAEQPFFLWVHYSDLRGKGASELKTLDKTIGGLVEWLKVKKLFEKSVIVLTSTQPQILGDHPDKWKGAYLYDGDHQAPLIFSGGGLVPKSTRSGALSSSVDVMPTILDLLSLEPAPQADGASLIPFFRQADPPPVNEKDKAIYLENFLPAELFGLDPTIGIRTSDAKLIRSGNDLRFFSLDENPLELSTLSSGSEEAQKELESRLREVEKTFSDLPTRLAVRKCSQISSCPERLRKLTGLEPEEEFLKLFPFEVPDYPLEDIPFLHLAQRLSPQRPSELLRTLEEYLEKNSHSKAHHLLRAQVVRALPSGKDQAISDAFLVLKQDPFYLPTFDLLTQEFGRTGAYLKLEELWLLAAVVHPEEFWPYWNLANLYLSQKTPEKIEGVFAALEEKAPWRAAPLWAAVGNVKMGKGDWKEAVPFLDRALTLNPRYLAARHLRASANLQLDQTAAALTDFSEIQKIDQDFYEETLYGAIMYQANAKSSKDVTRSLLKQLQATTKNKYYPAAAAAYLSIAGKDKAGIQEGIKKLQALDPKKIETRHLPLFYGLLGDLYLESADLEKAKEHYRKALEIDPYFPQSANNYAWLIGMEEQHVSEGTILEAIEWVRKALTKQPNSPHILDTLAELYFREGKIEAAIKTIQRAIQVAPEDQTLQERLRKYQTTTFSSEKKVETSLDSFRGGSTSETQAQKILTPEEREEIFKDLRPTVENSNQVPLTTPDLSKAKPAGETFDELAQSQTSPAKALTPEESEALFRSLRPSLDDPESTQPQKK